MLKNHVKEYRVIKGMTQIELAERTGVSRQSIIAIEKQKSEPSLSLAFRLSGCLDVDMNELFEEGVEFDG